MVSRFYCLSVNFTCVTINSGPGLSWTVNNDEIAVFDFTRFDPADGYPKQLQIRPRWSNEGITAEVTNGVIASRRPATINATMILRVSNISVLKGMTLTCQDSFNSSNAIRIVYRALRK